jgi:hypothetical protein
LDVLPLWLVLYEVALPIGNDLQHPHQGLLEVLQVFLPLKSCSKYDFTEKFAKYLFFGLTFLHLFAKFDQNDFCGLGNKALLAFLFTPKIVKCQFFYFFKKPCQIKHFSLITMKICQQHPKGRPHTQ